MAKLVAAFGSSHSIMLATQLEDWLHNFRVSDLKLQYFDMQGEPRSYEEVLKAAPADLAEKLTDKAVTARYHAVQDAMDHMREAVHAANLDVLLILGDDQYELFFDQHMPALAIYYGETIRNAVRRPVAEGDWFRAGQARRYEEHADRAYPCHAPLARHLIDALTNDEFDVNAMSGLRDDQYEGHAFSFIHRRYMPEHVVPIIPIFLNTYNPPNVPHPSRCVKLGESLKRAIESFPDDMRVGIMASGGLSHFVVDEPMDRMVFDAIGKKELEPLNNLDPRILKAGSSEIRCWIAVANAALDLDLTWHSYTPGYRTPAGTGTGLGFAVWG
ncbi:DODA-type extradiol aromatic ring-opening family dioxygenase [Paraburkholderia tropica]|uniref:DODA-type extradiol aromatic ring-opening family dioxygenase n=1 Tax=Paraburkholderia tropica TaxID=92647 RepID=UPI002AB6B41D|nr:protocatechuate 3,4-dioxygenase [Paraburkholderia tropica]